MNGAGDAAEDEEPPLALALVGTAVSSGVISVTSPSYTSLVSLILRPMARLKCSASTSVFLTSAE